MGRFKWNLRRKSPSPKRAWAQANGCPTCGSHWGGRVYCGKGKRAYVKGHRVYWPLGKDYKGWYRQCPDEHHDWKRFSYPDPAAVKDENEYVASLPHEGRTPMKPEAKERAAATRRRNRQRQGKGKR